jgi:F0F1-type ATP synthase assembly protein I
MKFHQLPWFAILTLTLGFFLGTKTIASSFPASGRSQD